MGKKGWVVGIDEVGRGPLAGPVYVCAFARRSDACDVFLHGIKDSKKLSAKKRAVWDTVLRSQGNTVRYAIGAQSALSIDQYGIVNALTTALGEALQKLLLDPDDCTVFLDGGLQAPQEYLCQSTHIKGDECFPEISAASILAKVARDAYMVECAKRYPQYDFEANKGYGTNVHCRAIEQYGLSPEHRRSFCKRFSQKTVV